MANLSATTIQNIQETIKHRLRGSRYHLSYAGKAEASLRRTTAEAVSKVLNNEACFHRVTISASPLSYHVKNTHLHSVGIVDHSAKPDPKTQER